MPQTITIARDERGVPHIQAETERGAIYAQGYVQAIDRLPSVYYGLRMAAGRLADVWTVGTVVDQEPTEEHDAAITKYPLCDDVSVLPDDERVLLEAFVAGLKHGIDASRERWGPAVMRTHIAPTPALVLKLSQAVTFPFIMDQAWTALDMAPPTPMLHHDLASNAWAVRPARTADGSTILLTDPHVLYTPEWLLHEVALHGGDLHVYGFQHPGTPYVHFGHNANVAWGFTSGGASVVNVRALPLGAVHPQNGSVWRNINSDELGHSTDYHVTTTYDNQPFDHITPLRAMAHAQNINAVKAVIALNQFGPWNMIAADSSGDIHYSIVGRVPIEGDVSKGIHAAADLPHVTNPPNGWLMHTNCSPWNVCPDNDLTLEHYPDYMLFHQRLSSTDGNNPRGRDLQKRLAADAQMTPDAAQAIAMSTDMSEGQAFLTSLIDITHDVSITPRPDMATALQLLPILQEIRLEQQHLDRALITFIELYLQLYNADYVDDAIGDIIPPRRNRLDVGTEITDIADDLLMKYGQLYSSQTPYLDYNRLQRGNNRMTVKGGPNFCQRIVACITSAPTPSEDGSFIKDDLIDYGQVCPLLVVFGPEGVRSFGVVPFGQSDDPNSPHYNDQMTTFARAEFYALRFAMDTADAKMIEKIEMP